MMMTMKLLRQIALLATASVLSFSFVDAGSTRWEKAQHAMAMTRDMILRVSHDETAGIKRRKGLTLISGGFPRTGTKSIETVLAQLGFKVYDSRAMVEHDHFDDWTNATRQWKQSGDLDPIRRMVEEMETLGYTATLDIPMNLLAPALIQVKPDAKVLWNYRAKGVDDWYESMSFINWFVDPLFYARPWKWIMPNPAERMRPMVQMLTSVSQPHMKYPDHFDRPLPWYERPKVNKHPMESDEAIKRCWTEAYLSFSELLQNALIEVKGSDALESQYLEYTVQQGSGPLVDFLLEEEDGRELFMEMLSRDRHPHVNDRKTLTIIGNLLGFIGMIFPLLALFLLYTVFALARGLIRLVTNTFPWTKVTRIRASFQSQPSPKVLKVE